MKQDSGAGIRSNNARRHRRYPAYKDSGVEWLGELPEDWEVLPLRRIVHSVEQGWSPVAEDRQADEDEWAVIRLSAVSKGTFRGDEHKALPFGLQVDQQLEIRSGDFLLTRANTPELVGDVCVAKSVRPRLMLCDLVYRLRLAPTRVQPEFLAYWLLSGTGRYQIEADARGSSQSMVKVSGGHVRSWLATLPPLTEQQGVVSFLDRATAKIAALIARNERLIELLAEKRAALITHAVTKGLDPNVPMKDSGIEWLGKIPDVWGLMPLGQAMERIMDFRGRTPLKLGQNWGGDIPAISAVNVRDGYLDLSRGVNYGSQVLHDRWMSQGVTRARDVIFTTEAPLGNVALLPDDRPYILSQRVVLLRPLRQSMGAEYLRYFLGSSAFRQGVESRATGSTAEGVKRGHLMAMPLCTPAIDNQRRIVTFLDNETTRLDALVAKVREAIERLTEYRAALITAAVTGEIDVREEVV